MENVDCMKSLVFLIIVLCLFLLYRIAFTKQPEEEKQNSDVPRNRETNPSEAVVKNRFVRPLPSQPQPTPATSLKTDKQEKKPDIFAAGNEKGNAVIPPDKLDDVFDNEPNPEELDISPDDEDETSEPEPDAEEESEDLRQTLGREAELADGMSIEEMESATEAVNNPTDEKAGLLLKIEPTDMFEQIVSGDEGKQARIKAIIDRHIQRMNPELEDKEDDSDNDLENFDVMKFLVKR
jgi:hypothetical protein